MTAPTIKKSKAKGAPRWVVSYPGTLAVSVCDSESEAQAKAAAWLAAVTK